MRHWGPEGFQGRVDASWKPFVGAAEGWIEVVTRSGAAAVEQVYREMLEGRTAPDQGYVLSL